MESLGKKGKEFYHVSTMPRDNHSLMQYYLGVQNHFFTFFFVKEKIQKTKKLFNQITFFYKNKSLNETYSQFNATQNVFKQKKYLLEVF